MQNDPLLEIFYTVSVKRYACICKGCMHRTKIKKISDKLLLAKIYYFRENSHDKQKTE